MKENSQNTSSCHPSSIRSVALLVAAEVESVLEDGLGLEAELPEERCHVAVMTALVQQQMDDQLAPAVVDRLTVDVNLVSLAEVGVGPCVDMGSKWVARPATVRGD